MCESIKRRNQKHSNRKCGIVAIILVAGLVIVGLLISTNTPNARRASCGLAKHDHNAKAIATYCETEVIYHPAQDYYSIETK